MREKKDYIWAIFLIFLGTIFLLNTTGMLPWNVWTHILSYWPIFLILGGLRLILGKGLISTIILSVVALLAFIWIGISAYFSNQERKPLFLNNFPIININNQVGESVSNEFSVKTKDYENVESLDYNFDLGVSKFDITDGSEEYLYVKADYTTQYGEPKITEDLNNGILSLEMKEERAVGLGFWNFETPDYNISLGSNIPSNITMENGVGNGTIDLDSQQIKNLIVSTGTGEIDITLGLNSIPTEKISVDIGTGNIKLNLPSTVGYIISYNVGVGEINLGDTKIGGVGHDASEVKSDNYDTAEKIVNIIADVGVGQLDINFNN